MRLLLTDKRLDIPIIRTPYNRFYFDEKNLLFLSEKKAF